MMGGIVEELVEEGVLQVTVLITQVSVVMIVDVAHDIGITAPALLP